MNFCVSFYLLIIIKKSVLKKINSDSSPNRWKCEMISFILAVFVSFFLQVFYDFLISFFTVSLVQIPVLPVYYLPFFGFVSTTVLGFIGLQFLLGVFNLVTKRIFETVKHASRSATALPSRLALPQDEEAPVPKEVAVQQGIIVPGVLIFLFTL